MVTEAQKCQVLPSFGRFDSNGREQVGREVNVVGPKMFRLHCKGFPQPVLVVSCSDENHPVWALEIVPGKFRGGSVFCCKSSDSVVSIDVFMYHPFLYYLLPVHTDRPPIVFPINVAVRFALTKFVSSPSKSNVHNLWQKWQISRLKKKTCSGFRQKLASPLDLVSPKPEQLAMHSKHCLHISPGG